MILIYPSTDNLGSNPILTPKAGNQVAHLKCGVDASSATLVARPAKDNVVYLYLIKAPDSDVILPEELEESYQVSRALEYKEHWLTIGAEAKLIGAMRIISLDDKGEPVFEEVGLDNLKEQPVEELDWLDYYCEALRANMFTKRKWLLDVFTVKRTYVMNAPYMIGKDEEKGCYYSTRPNGARIDIVNVPLTHPVVGLFRKVTAYKGDLINLKKTVETTTGELLVNALAFCYKYEDFREYQSGKIMPDDFHEFYSDLLKAGKLTDTDVLRDSIAATEQLSAYADFAVPAASRATMSMHPDNKRVRDEGIKELGDDVNDQAKLAALDKKLVELDKEHVKGSPSETFFIKGKMHNVVRKKTGMMYGSEEGLDGVATPTVTTSLEEGIKIENIPAHVNAVRAGANARGLKTAEGGYDMKETIRMLSAYLITEEDCKSKEGIEILLRPEDVKLYEGRYLVGLSESLTKDKLKSLIGKKIVLRDPAYCKTSEYGLCNKCMGEQMRSLKHGIAFEASTLGGEMQNASMQAAHGKALTVKFYDPEIYCS